MWAIPFRIAFEVPITEALFWVDLAFDFFFLLDMLTNARTGYHTSVGLFVTDDWLVLRHYLLGWFTIDLLSTVPIDTIVGASLLGSANSDTLVLRSVKLVRVLRLFRLLKLARLFKLRKALSAIEGVWAVNAGFLRVARLMAEVMLMAHLLACAWYWVPSVEAPPVSGRDSWYTVAGITESTDLATRYIISLCVVLMMVHPAHARFVVMVIAVLLRRYWATKSMMSVGTRPTHSAGCAWCSRACRVANRACDVSPGYGDVRAVSTTERVVSIATQCIGVSVFGFIVANISSMLATLNVRGSLLSEKMSEVRGFRCSLCGTGAVNLAAWWCLSARGRSESICTLARCRWSCSAAACDSSVTSGPTAACSTSVVFSLPSRTISATSWFGGAVPALSTTSSYCVARTATW